MQQHTSRTTLNQPNKSATNQANRTAGTKYFIISKRTGRVTVASFHSHAVILQT